MSWWNIFGSDDKTAAGVNTDAKEEIGGLNFKTALESHIKWKIRLMGVIEATETEILDPRVVSQDNQCALGKWIYGEGGKEYGYSSEFKELALAHTHFHVCAGHVLDLALEGRTAEAKAEVDGGDFAKASQATSRHLLRLWRSLGI
jgi:hypothetical protein